MNGYVCEDSKSAYFYFEECKKYFRLNTASVIVTPSPGSAPISVVDYAIEIAQNTPDIDRMFCVFDRDNHESYTRAIDKLKRYRPKRNDKSKPKYAIITSTPCFELWLLLHFRYTTKAYAKTGNKTAADHLISDLCEEIPRYAKNTTNWFNDLKDKFDIAIRNAKQLAKYNEKTNSMNPATNTHELIDYLMNLKRN